MIQQLNEELQDAISLMIVLENDLLTQKSDDIYIRIVKIVHGIISLAQDVVSEIIKTEKQ